MIFTIVLVLLFVLAVVGIFAYQKIYNPGRLCKHATEWFQIKFLGVLSVIQR